MSPSVTRSPRRAATDRQVANCVGAVISPLLANVYLHALDRAWQERHGGLGVLVRYADDLVVLCGTQAQAEAALAELRALLAELGLELAEAKTRLVCLNEDGEGFDFLGFHHRMVESYRKPGRRFLARLPSARAMQAARQRIREITDRRWLLRPPEEIVADLNRFLIGWGGYFRHGNSSRCFDKIALPRQETQGPTPAQRRARAARRAARPDPAQTRRNHLPRSRARHQVKDVGEPCEGEPHARFDAAAGGDQRQSVTHRAAPGASRRPDPASRIPEAKSASSHVAYSNRVLNRPS